MSWLTQIVDAVKTLFVKQEVPPSPPRSPRSKSAFIKPPKRTKQERLEFAHKIGQLAKERREKRERKKAFETYHREKKLPQYKRIQREENLRKARRVSSRVARIRAGVAKENLSEFNKLLRAIKHDVHKKLPKRKEMLERLFDLSRKDEWESLRAYLGSA